tara:strand:- start:2533 stop:3396 length:864 start_codon:yes stop_codon:yes gene_type:complete
VGFSGIVNAPVGPIGALRALGMTLLVVLATQGLQLLVAGSFMAVRGSDLTEAVARVAEHPLSLATAQLLGFVVILRWALRAFVPPGVPPRMAFALDEPPALGVLGIAILAGLALQLPLAEIGNAIREVAPTPLDQQLRVQRALEPRTLGAGLGAIFAFVVVAPLTEEVFFRGLLLPGLAARHGAGPAVVLSALLFALLHFGWAAAGVAFVAGLLLGAVRVRAGSLWPSIALHASINAVPLLLPRAVWSLPGFNEPSAAATHLPPLVLFGALGFALVSLLLLERALRR